MIESINLDPTGNQTIPWSRAVAQLDQLQPAGGSRGPTCWLSTNRPDGRPHTAGVVGHWLDDTLYFVSGPQTRKSRNLAADPHCWFAISFADLDLVLEGTATAITDPDILSSVAEFVQLQRAPAAWHPQVPVVAVGAPSQLAFTPYDETSTVALLESLSSREVEIQFQHEHPCSTISTCKSDWVRSHRRTGLRTAMER